MPIIVSLNLNKKMKKSILLSIVAAIAVAMTFVSCGEKQKTQNTEEPIVGTDYIIVTSPEGAKGLKKGEIVLFEPKAEYKDITVEGGMFVAKMESGWALLDPETGYQTILADTLTWKDFFFEGIRGENYLVYIPAYKRQFAAQEYVVRGSYAIATFLGKITIWQDGKQLIEPNDEYSKIAILPEGKLLVLDGNIWGTASVTKERLIQPGKRVQPRDLRKYKAMKGWSDGATVMILEQ